MALFLKVYKIIFEKLRSEFVVRYYSNHQKVFELLKQYHICSLVTKVSENFLVLFWDRSFVSV